MGDPDQAKIHLNPDFISRSGTLLNQKVHINPAFLLKSQGIHQTQRYVNPAPPYASNSGHDQHWQEPASGVTSHASHINANQSHTQDGNTTTNIYSYSSKSVHDHNISTSYPKSYTLYKKTNIHNTYDNSYSRYKHLPQTQSIAAKNSAVTKHPSTYSWKATNTNGLASNQGHLSTSMKGHSNVNLVKDSAFVTQHYTYQNPASKYSSVNKSFIRTTVTRRTGIDTETRHKKDKPTASHSSLHSLTYDKKSTEAVKNPVIVAANTTSNLHTSKIKSETAPSQTAVQRNSEKGTKNRSPSSHVIKIESETKPFDTLTQSASAVVKMSEFIKSPKRELSNTCSPSTPQILGSYTTAKSVHVIPHQKFVSRNKVVNSSSEKPVLTEVVNLKDNGVNAAVKTPKSKGNYKIISKTKLVQTHLKSATRSKVQQEGVAGQSPAQTSKATTHTSPRVTTISRPQRLSPADRIHQTAPKLSTKKKYSVLSRTKLVRRQSGSGKAGTLGKPSYTVNTKNKLVRRRSSSGTGLSKSSSKIGESKAKTSGMPAKPKYSVITKNKLVRRRSSSGAGISKSSGKISELKTKTYKSQTEGQKKFHVISQTKLVRRRSSSGAYKELSAQGLGATPPSHSRKRVIVKRHKLIRNVSSAPLKYDYATVSKLYTRNVNTAFKVININPNISAKQRVARGIVSKYKINRLKQESYDGYKKHQKSFNRYKINRFKPESAHGSKRYRKYNDYSSKARQSKKSCASKRSDRFINIGGILYKSTKTSLRKQLPKDKNNKPSVKKFDSRCTVFLRGEKFHLTAGGRTLQRVQDSTPARSSLPRVHLGGLTYSRTRTGLYELTKTHQARAVLSSARQRSMVTLIQKRKKASFQKRNEYCVFFNRFGRCSKKNRGECPYIHDSTRVAICTRFLRGRCPVNNCPFSHTVDPHKMPVCSHFLKSVCTREDCPYRHVKVNPSAPVCLDFVRGYCKAGEECDKQHILVCEEFKAGKCPRGASCPLSHHKGRKRRRTVSFSRSSNPRSSFSMYRKRKRSESLEILGGPPVTKKRVEKKKRNVKAGASHQRYFHVVAGEESEDKNNQKLPVTSELCDNPEPNIHTAACQDPTLTPLVSDGQVSKAESQGDKLQKDQVEATESCCTSLANKSAFEETRSRVLKKIDVIKKFHVGLSSENCSDGSGTTMSNTGEPRDPRHPANTNKEELDHSSNQMTINEISLQSSDTENPDSDTFRVQRPPLPKRLPSYIPLDFVDL